MSTTLTITGITATTCSIAFTNLPGGGTVEIQIADNPSFFGLVSFKTYAATPAGIVGLNQRGTYYARGRTVTAGGALGAWGAIEGIRTSDGVAWITAPQNTLVSPAIIVPPEPVLAIATEVGSVAGYPASNLLRDDPNLVWAASSGAGTYMVLKTAGQPIDTFALLDCNSSAPQLQIVCASTMADAINNTGDAVDHGSYSIASANLPQRPGYHFLIRIAAPTTKRFHLFNVVGTLLQGQLQARYAVVGLARTAKNITTDKTETPLDLGSIDRTRSGGPNRVWGQKMRRSEFEISVMTEMQWETQFGDLWRKIGLSEPVLVVPNSRTGAFLHDRILFGTVAQQRATNVNSPIFTHGFSVESLI